MTTRNNPRPAATRSDSKSRMSATLVAGGVMLLLTLLSIALLPATTRAAQPSSGTVPNSFQQADPTQALPTAQTDVTNQQGGSEEDDGLQGGSTENDSNSGTNSNSNNNEQNPPSNNVQGGNPTGNTGGSDSPSGGFPWWILVFAVLLIAVAIPFLRRRPFNEPATANPAPDLERRDQQ